MRPRQFPPHRFSPIVLSRLGLGCLALLATLVGPPNASAVPMVNDPKGFQDIPWGASLKQNASLEPVASTDRITEYRFKDGTATFGGVPVESIKLSAIDDRFARVTVRYRGKARHRQLVIYLQTQYGPLDDTPGQFMTGADHQFRWRGADTEVNVTFEGKPERGFIFIESSALAPVFTEAAGGM